MGCKLHLVKFLIYHIIEISGIVRVVSFHNSCKTYCRSYLSFHIIYKACWNQMGLTCAMLAFYLASVVRLLIYHIREISGIVRVVSFHKSCKTYCRSYFVISYHISVLLEPNGADLYQAMPAFYLRLLF